MIVAAGVDRRRWQGQGSFRPVREQRPRGPTGQRRGRGLKSESTVSILGTPTSQRKQPRTNARNVAP